jgi:hypothetical protein
MTSARQIAANRANAQLSTGPRTEQGKARASRNARRHGLSVPVLADTGLANQVEDLAYEIADGGSNAGLLEPARCIAEAQVDLDRIRHVRYELLSQGQDKHGTKTFVHNLAYKVRQLARLDRYHRRTLSRRKFAARAFDLARGETD